MLPVVDCIVRKAWWLETSISENDMRGSILKLGEMKRATANGLPIWTPRCGSKPTAQRFRNEPSPARK